MTRSRIAARALATPPPAGASGGHSEAEHIRETVSVTCRSSVPPSRVNRLSGCETATGAVSSSGSCPVRIDGSACHVDDVTVVVFRYQCEPAASSAMFG